MILWSQQFPANTANPKAAMDVIAKEHGFPPGGLTIPVCLDSDRLYNVEDTLAAVILEQQDEGEKARFLRVLEVRKKREAWEKLVVQMRNAGRVLTEWIR